MALNVVVRGVVIVNIAREKKDGQEKFYMDVYDQRLTGVSASWNTKERQKSERMPNGNLSQTWSRKLKNGD